MPRFGRSIFHFGLAMFTAIALSACNEEDAEGGAQSGALPSVVVTEVTSRDVVETERFIGRAEAVDTTDLRARVEGFLEERRVREGERVSEGDTLFKIEPAPYEAALAQADSKVGNDYLIGGVLCEGCATSWYEWVQDSRPCTCPGCPQQEEDGADS